MRLAALFIISLTFGVMSVARADTTRVEARLLKNWTLSRCLAQAFNDEEVKADAAAAAAVYLELGKQPIETYEKINVLITRALQQHATSSTGKDLRTLKCLDLYGSRELDRLVLSLTR